MEGVAYSAICDATFMSRCVIRVRFREELFISSTSAKNKPQMNADERRFIVPGLHWRGAGSLPAWLRQWRRAEGRGLGIGERGAQSKFIFKYHQVLSEYLFFFVDRRVL